MTTIVVPLDGSTFAERAVRPACSLAMRLDGARVLLLSCVTSEADGTRRRLQGLAELFADVVEIDVRVVEDAEPADAIDAALAADPDAMLCMATHGRGGVRTTVLGSVTRRVVCRSTRPLVLVGPNCGTALLPGERGRMVVCSDGSPFAESVLPVAADMADRFGLEPWIVEVVGPDEDPESAQRIPNRVEDAAQADLDRLVERLGRPVRTAVLHGNPSRSIARFAEELPAAMIAMTTHGRTGLTQLAMGSVATEVARHAPCPLLISRPPSAVQACLDG